MAKTTQTPTRFACPLCAKSCKITSTSKVARHGFRRFGSDQNGICPTSGHLAGVDALDAALAALDYHRAALVAKQAERVNGWRAGQIKSITEDMTAVAQAALTAYCTSSLASGSVDADQVETRSRALTELQAA